LLLARFDVEPPLELTDVHVDELVRDVVSDAAAADPRRNFGVDVLPVMVRADSARLSQVLVNLVTNARVHTNAQTPITVRVTRDDTSALVEVIDLGPGLTEDVAAHVFDRFYRADPARARRSGGAGLGLAIVQSIVIAHGGTVGVHSTPGHGATFWLRLPLAAV
jgi:two-component system OmpR family sensor kinase